MISLEIVGSNASYAYGSSGSSTGDSAFVDLRKLRPLEDEADDAKARMEEFTNSRPAVDLNIVAIIVGYVACQCDVPSAFCIFCAIEMVG